mgnify:CR=1 FL=1
MVYLVEFEHENKVNTFVLANPEHIIKFHVLMSFGTLTLKMTSYGQTNCRLL